MYIDRAGGEYFKSYFNSLDEAGRKQFITEIKKVCGERIGVSYKKIRVDDLYSTDRMDIDVSEMITPEMLRTAFWSIWKGDEE